MTYPCNKKLNPGKSIMDAMESLADSKTGEMERLKEFGVKVSAKQFKGYVGKGENDDLTDAETNTAYNKLIAEKLSPTYKGGADKLSDSSKGKWSTLTGNAQYYASLAGRSFLSLLNGPMDKINTWFDKNGESLKKWANGFGASVNKALNSEGFKSFLDDASKVGAWLQRNLPNAAKIALSALSGLRGVGQMLSPAFKIAADVIQKLLSVLAAHPTAVKNVAFAFGSLMIISKIGAGVLFAVEVFSKLRTTLMFVTGASSLLKLLGLNPVGLAIGAVILALVLCITHWKDITAWMHKAKEKAGELWTKFKESPLGTFLKDTLGPIIDGFKSLVGWVEKAIDKIKELRKANGEKDYDPNNKVQMSKKGSDHAIGLDRVPFDNYLANLHQGEMVLTRQEADRYRGLMGGSSSNNSIGIQGVVDSINNSQNNVENAVGNTIKLITKPFDALNKDMPATGQNINQGLMNGINSTTSNVTESVKTLTDKVINQFKEGFGIHSPSVIMFEMGSHLLQGFINGMSSKDLKGFIDKQIGSIVGAFSGAVNGSVTEWLTQALMATGTSLDWLPGLQKLVMAESSGNPNAINPQAVGSEYATGLLQTLPSTFNSYSEKGMNNILNPVHNAAAAINYIKSRYGSVFNTPLFKGGSYVGYAIGTNRVPYDNMPAMLHQDEAVLNRNEADLYRKSKMNTSEIKQTVSTSNITNHNQIDIHIDGAQDTHTIVKEMVNELKNVIKNTSGNPALV